MTDQNPDLLDELFEAVGPYVKAAAASASSQPATTIARIYPSPLRVDVAHQDRAGRERVFRAPGDPVLAEIMATFLNGGVAELPDSPRRAALALVSRGDAELIVLIDVDAGNAGGALVPEGTAEPVLLFVRHRPETRH